MTMFRVGPAGGGIPAALKTDMNSVLNKKFGTVAQNYPPNEWPDDVNLLGMLEEKTTASASIAHIDDGASEVPLKNWLVTLPASLSGYSEVNAYKQGANVIDYASNLTTGTSGGLTFSVTANGGISYSGTASSTFAYMTAKFDFAIKSGQTFTFSRDTAFSYIHRITLTFSDDTTANVSISANDTSVTYTPAKDVIAVRLLVAGLTTNTAYNDTVYLMTEYGSTANAYEAYTAPTQYTASLGRTIYGGQADIVTGGGTDEYAKGSMTSTYLSGLSSSYIGYEASLSYFGGHASVWVRNWNYQTASARTAGGIGAVCNHFPISFNNSDIFASQYRVYFDVDGKNISSVQDFIDYVSTLEQNNDSLDIVYELATSTDFTFTPITPTPETENVCNFWADEGDSSVTYRSTDTIQPAPTPTLITKTITANGTYDAEDDSADGYSSVEVEVYQGDGGLPITLVATEIATDANQTGTLTFTEDYHDYPILKVRTYNPTNQDYVDIYCTPQFIDDAFTYSSNKANFNRMGTNLYAYYGAGANNTWVRGGQRTITVTSVFGIMSSSHDIEVVNLYRYQAITANNRSVSFSGNTSDYQYLMISMCDGDSTETEPSIPIVPVGNSGIKDLVKYVAGMAYNVTRTFVIEQNAVSDFMITQKYGFFTIDGVNFTPKTAT